MSNALGAALAAIADDPACRLASLSVHAVRDGKAVYDAQFGMRTLGPRPASTDADTLFRIASISKLVTTLGLMRLLEQGKVALDADVSDYLGFPLRNPHFPQQPISLRLLLTHTSSLRDAGGYSWPCSVPLREAIGPAMWSADAAPGTYFSYCNLGWGVIGTIMEAVSGERFDRLMRRLVLTPLAMRGGYNPSELAPAELDDLATLYRKRPPDTEQWDAAGPWFAQVDDYSAGPPARPAGIDTYKIGSNATPFSPTGGLRTSARCLGQVMQMLAAGGMFGGRRFLSSATLGQMLARAWSVEGRGDTDGGVYQYWGLGNQQFPTLLPGFSGVGHLGEAYGLHGAFVFDPHLGSGLAMLAGGVSSEPAPLPHFTRTILAAMHRHLLS